ncbi:MAG TPA: O-antigen ligase family protein [Blastocatellia bacterium]|nr:O-antigen ligase family protein [Blastocatellia bacterium]
MKRAEKRESSAAHSTSCRAEAAAFWLIVSLLVAVPLIFSTSLHRVFSLPKFAALISGAAALTPLLVLAAFDKREGDRPAFSYLTSKHVLLVCLYMIAVSISTLFGVAPVASLVGSSYNKMGLITQLCFFLCFAGLIITVGGSLARLQAALWGMALTGLVVASYAYLQFFGRDPFIPASLYTFDSAVGPVVRVCSTLGHSNYLGNFLLYTTPLSAGLALAARGTARRLGFIAAVVSVMALAFSGTRGAWVGLAAGALAFVVLMIEGSKKGLFELSRRKVLIRAGAAFAAILIAVWLIALNPASRNIALRARSFITEGFTGAGRTLLWRDSVRMVPAFALSGCGPEGFRKAFLAYKSRELARYSPQINNESSHNSYLDAAISYGLPGVICYVAIIGSSFALMLNARRRTNNPRLRVLITGLLSSLLGVTVHNFFIFDQIPTGLYFFALASLAAITKNVVDCAEERAGSKSGIKTWPRLYASVRLKHASVVLCAVMALGSAWYAVSLVRADSAINRAFEAAANGNLEQVVFHGRRATGGPDPSGDYDFFLARALTLCAERLKMSGGARDDAIRLAITHAEASVARSLTPDSNHLLLAYLGLMSGDEGRLRAHASEAIKWDPNFSNARWLMAEAYFAGGDRDRAASEAAAAVDLNPSSREARSVLKRVRADRGDRKQRVEQLMARAKLLENEGRTKKAQRVMLRAMRIQKAAGARR